MRNKTANLIQRFLTDEPRFKRTIIGCYYTIQWRVKFYSQGHVPGVQNVFRHLFTPLTTLTKFKFFG